MVTWFPSTTSQPCAALLAASALAGMARRRWPQHRARLSADLADHLARRLAVDRGHRRRRPGHRRAAGQAVQPGGEAAAARAAACCVVNAGQLAALQADAELDHLSGNIRYRTLAIDPM